MFFIQTNCFTLNLIIIFTELNMVWAEVLLFSWEPGSLLRVK